MTKAGKLYIVATPIGNLADITLRAITLLNEVDLIAAEDTRHSKKLLQHHDIGTRLIALHDHNEKQRAQSIIDKLYQGLSIALISDAGTPLISDPGYNLVNLCREADLEVVPVPGACAAITALCASGLPTDSFRFEGFLPVKQQAKENGLRVLEKETATTIFYESPRRVLDTLETIEKVLGTDRKVVLAKELTKTFETFYQGSAEDCKQWLAKDEVHQKGEFVLMIAGVSVDHSSIPAEAENLLRLLCAELPTKKAAALTAAQYDLKKNALYQLALSWQD